MGCFICIVPIKRTTYLVDEPMKQTINPHAPNRYKQLLWTCSPKNKQLLWTPRPKNKQFLWLVNPKTRKLYWFLTHQYKTYFHIPNPEHTPYSHNFSPFSPVCYKTTPSCYTVVAAETRVTTGLLQKLQLLQRNYIHRRKSCMTL
jgi:hypothetical protein